MAAALAALAASAWLLLVPVTVIYVSSSDGPEPREVSSRYSWWTSEQNLLHSDAVMASQPHSVNGVRLAPEHPT